MIPARNRRISISAVGLSLGLLSAIASPARAQGVPPSKATPQATYAAPQTAVATPQYAAGGTYASPQVANRPCACYFPQGFCAFPRGNCVAVRPSSQWPSPQWPSGTSQFEPTQPEVLSPSASPR